MSEKLIVFFDDANDRFGLEDGFVLHAQGEHFEQIADRHEGFAARYPIQETVPGGARIMVWEGERHRECQWDSDDDPVFRGAWRAATADDLIKAGILERGAKSAEQDIDEAASSCRRAIELLEVDL